MKKLLVFLIGTFLCVTLASCNEPLTESESSEMESVSVDEFSEALWPSWDDGIAFTERVIPGQVTFSSYMSGFLDAYSGDQKIVVLVCYASMIPENYLETLMYEGVSAAEYYQQYEELFETDPEAADVAYNRYEELSREYLRGIYNSLSFPMEKRRMRGGVNLDNQSFYACMTKEELLSLTCEPNEAFFVCAAHFK